MTCARRVILEQLSTYYIYVYYMYILYLCQVGKNQDEMDWK